MVKTSKTSAAEQIRERLQTPREELKEKPVVIFSWAHEWSCQRNALLQDDKGAFYLGDFYKDGSIEIGEPVSVPEALLWYAETSKYAEGSTGDIARLCRTAAGDIGQMQRHISILDERLELVLKHPVPRKRASA